MSEDETGGVPPTPIDLMTDDEFSDALREHKGELVRLQIGAAPPRMSRLIELSATEATVQYHDGLPPEAPFRVPISDIKVVYAEESAFGRG